MSNLFGPNKDDLRKNLPLREVASQLTQHYGASGPYILVDGTALCPFHSEVNPSFYLWQGDDGLERWWCQPCGFGGDIFDLIRRTLSVSFPEALAIGQAMWDRLPPNYVKPTGEQAKVTRPTVEAYRQSIDSARAYAATKPGIFAIMLGLVPNDHEHADEAAAFDRFVRDRWGWGLAPPDGYEGAGVVRGNVILMPHWNGPDEIDLGGDVKVLAQEITGCKTRSGSQKGSLPGSKYLALYGSWLGRQFPRGDVLLTEGESDSVYGSWRAHNEGVPIDVFGLPGGAMKPPMQHHADFLQGARTIYLAFDPDDAGVDATRRWVTFLSDRGFADIRICFLPYKIDLRQARASLPDLLARAKRPLAMPTNYQSTPGGYRYDTGKTDDNGNPITMMTTNWTVEPTARLAGGEAGFDVVIQTRGAAIPARTIRLADMKDVPSLRKWANENELQFNDGEAMRKCFAQWVEARGSVVPVIYQTNQLGAHPAPTDYEFAGETFVYATDYQGKLPWRYVVRAKESPKDVTDQILLPHEAGFEWEWIDAFLRLSSTDVTHPMLAWVVASMRRHTTRDFPMLYIGGASGVGKSTLARLCLHLGGSGIEVNLGAVTPFILTKTLAATTNVPVFVDEWTLLSRKDTLMQFQGAIPLLYAGEKQERGQADLGMVTFRQTAPCIIAGEQELELDRELDRMVTIFPSRSAQNKDALAAIEDAPLQGFAHSMHRYFLNTKEDISLTQHAATRPAYNEAVLRDGWRMLLDFSEKAHTAGEDVPEFPAEPDLSCFEKVAEERSGGNSYDDALFTGLPMKDSNAIPLVWADPEGRGTYVRIRELLGAINRRGIEMRLPGGERALIRYFEERYAVTRERDVRPTGNGTRVRAVLIHDLHLLPLIEEGNVIPT